MDTILILDFGSQTTQLIARRLRDMGAYTEIAPGDADLSRAFPSGLGAAGIKGIILSGSPESVYDEGAAPDRAVYDCGLPLLGICYGLQRMTADMGGAVEALPAREYGRIGVSMPPPGSRRPVSEAGERFLAGFPAGDFAAWMSHGDTITKLAPGFAQVGTSASGFPAVVAHESRPWVGLQFHPEVTHCEGGPEILGAFAFGACLCEGGWTMRRYVDESRDALRARVGEKPVLLLISGGVDSTVAGALLLSVLPRDQVRLLYVDTGLMRKGETENVRAALEKLGAAHLRVALCEDEFLSALSGLSDPEEKRKAIGDLFIKIQEREVALMGLPADCFLAQGTLYTDLIESGKGVGKKARLIKSHHNVASPLVEAKRRAGLIIEPLDRLYKDEARALGRLLGVGEEVVGRHPFPGPGLAVRVPGEVTKERCDVLREADAIYMEELKRRKTAGGRSLYDDIWQAFAVLLPVRSVGVAGDLRKYGWVLALRAVASADGMSADAYPFEARDLLEISARITNEVPEIGRVVYDISSKPPATIEWE
ncbi:MAG: glutamine-hydrolyzing GMP synthase [Treponema sp.]|nr:glutamine-hydrolyzing GMP synthase [Treponema sp.]